MALAAREAVGVTALLAFVALTACSEDTTPFGLTLLKAPSRQEEGACRDRIIAEDEFKGQLPANEFTLRVSFLRRGGDDVGPGSLRDLRLVCDRIIDPGTDARRSEFLVPTGAGTDDYVIRVEAFRRVDDQTYELAYSGQRHDVDIASDNAKVYLHPTGEQSCHYVSSKVHAFHTATLLPNGRVVAIGGLIGADGSNKLSGSTAHAQREVSVFNPSTLEWQTARGQVPGRAFHQAVLLPSAPAGPYRVLLVGGLLAPAVGKPIVTLGDPSQPFLFSPHEEAEPGEAGIVTISFGQGAEDDPVVEYSPLPTLRTSLFPSVVLSGDAKDVLVVPGATEYAASGEFQGFAISPRPVAQWVSLGSTTSLPSVVSELELSRVRVGHAAARTGNRSFLILGGNMDGDNGQLVSHRAALVADKDGLETKTVDGSAVTTAWHSLTDIGLTDARRARGDWSPLSVWAGGFTLEDGSTSQFRFGVSPQASALQLVFVDPSGTQVAASAQGDLIESTAYHQGTAMFDGAVLLSGGNTRRLGADPSSQCPKNPQVSTTDTVQTAFCPLDQLAILDVAASGATLELRAGTPSLSKRRYGHQVTRLLDNTVLFTGGVSLDASAVPVALAQAELYNPRTGAASEDYLAGAPEGRPPGTAAKMCETREVSE